jgi:hypothetical protein
METVTATWTLNNQIKQKQTQKTPYTTQYTLQIQQPGNYTLTLTAKDPQNTTTQHSWKLNIQKNLPPSLNLIINQTTLQPGQQTTLTAKTQDPDNYPPTPDTLTIRLNQHTIATKTGQPPLQITLTFQYNQLPHPQNTITATATDGMTQTQKKATINKIPNQPPQITSYTPTNPDTTVILETNPTITYNITATDPDGHKINYEWQIKKPNETTQTITETNTTTLTPTQTGTYNIKATITDEYGASNSHEWTLTAKNNTPPTINTTLQLTEGQPPTTINLETITQDDPEQKGKHTYTNATSNNPRVTTTLQGKTLTITMHEDYNTEEHPGTTITININDGITTATGSINLNVTAQPDISGTIKDVITQTPQNNITLLLDETPININPNGTYRIQTTPGTHTLHIPENPTTWEYERKITLNKKDTQIPPIQTLSKKYPLHLHWMTDQTWARNPETGKAIKWIPGMNWQWPENITIYTLNMPDHWRNTILNYVLPKMKELFTTPQGQLLQNYTFIGEYHDNRPDSILHKEYNRNIGDLRIWFRSNESMQGKSGLAGIIADTLGNVHFGMASINRELVNQDSKIAVAMQEIMQALMPSPADASKKIFPEYQSTVFADDPMEQKPTDWGQGPAGIIQYTAPDGTTIPIEVERLKAITKKHYYQGPGKKQATIWYDEKTNRGGIKEPPIKN